MKSLYLKESFAKSFKPFGKISLAALLVAASCTAMAASNVDSKPRCPKGQVAKFENGQWVCKDLVFQAQNTAERNSAKPGRKPGARPTTPQSKQAQDKKPDLTIMHVSRVGGESGKFGVQIKNAGQANSPDVQLFGTNTANGNAVHAAADVPKIKAGKTEWVFITFPGQSFDRGDRVQFFVDGLNQATESNENNNKKSINYQ